MRYVLDQNMSQDPRLDKLLKVGNEIILTDDYFVEPFKHHSPKTMFSYNLKILREYSNQILVTYDRGDLIRKELSNFIPIKTNDLIDERSTIFIRNLLKCKEKQFINDLNLWKKEANDRIKYHTNFLEKHIRKLAQTTSDLLKSKNEIMVYKTDKDKRLNDIKETSFEVLKQMLNDHCSDRNILNIFKKDLSINYSHIFIHLWRVVDWAIKDGFQNATKSIKGDSFDMKYILISSFFDDILTQEIWMKTCREDLLKIFYT